MSDLFVTATRNKVRFSYKGALSVEDLWDLTVEELDAVYRELNGQLKRANEDSLLQKPTAAAEELKLKVEVVKFIVTIKLNEANERKLEAEKIAKKGKILAILEQKQTASLAEKSEGDLLQMLNEL